MSTQWTSKYEILVDLSLAQGLNVPAALDSTLGADEKPPAPNIAEETEEDYFGLGFADGDTAVEPDLTLIQQMLEMVRDTDISSDYENEPDKVLEISKHCENRFIQNINIPLTNNSTNVLHPQTKIIKKKRENVALNSILEAIAGDISIQNMEKPNEMLKLLKPTDFISTNKEIVNSVNKVNGWLDSQLKQQNDTNEDVRHSANRTQNWEPSSMFRRKSGSIVKSSGSSPKNSPTPQVTATASYRPSTLADEYYQKYVERSKMKELVTDDMWTKAEKAMKEIDANKKAEMEEIAKAQATKAIPVINNFTETTEDNRKALISNEKFAVVQVQIQLPQHRHLLTGKCVVCEVVKGRGFDADNSMI